ncbi:GT2 family glycosyltransferase [Arthrobacter sp. V4I6]|uniref:glycosyltransferase family 2 protein n=1 Tax=unclassified Arthrobacter TaxID=235627 RepID=UPI00277F6D31|nr:MULTISPECIES: glycosyltransferase family 2 protein [unclassified Arthrobacter]MDQ0822134.1 GT2 family glycosyltransferase [Arthrobacter sp. V1I7]MDQ0856401.1 GT2 family glycosyltransferase [Arthrobacter sp. V4I6]
MVSHDGGDFLPRTLAALAGQTRPADAVIGVDTGSRDHSAALLEQAFGKANVTHFEQARSGMGAAVAAGLSAHAPWHAEAGTARDGGAAKRPGADWIWLLHDDAAPAPEALAELLHAVERAPSVTVAGCKQLDWHAERRLIDVGLSTSRWAERLTLIDADELDQGQYDGRSDTFAVNSAGMLVRRDVWEDLGGFDPALPGSGDDVDFCWRNRLAGHRVVVVPTARMFHVSHRPQALGNARAARKAQVHLRLKHSAGWQVPLHAAGALLGSVFKLVLSIAVKDPGHGFSQLLATFVALGRPAAVIRGRRNAAKSRRIRRSVIKGLQTPRREVWAHRRSLMEALGADDAGERVTGDGLADQPSGDSAHDFAALATSERGWVGNGALLAVLVTTAASLIGLLNLFRADAASGGALIPVSPRLAEIWTHASGWWISLGAGLPGRGDPFDYVLWLLGVLGAGDANAAVVWLLILAMPLSALGAWFAAGALTQRRRLRLVAASFWACAPALQVALNQGRLGALLAHVLMPLLVLALLRATGTAVGRGRYAVPAPGERRFTEKLPARPGINGTPSWTAAAAAGLALAVVTAAAPALLVPSIVVVILCGVLLGRRGRTVWWALLPSAALFVPFAFSVIDRPRALLADPGLPLGFDAAPLWQQALGQPLGFAADGGLTGLPFFGGTAGGPLVPWALMLALLVGLPVLLLATAALFLPGRRAYVARWLWAASVLMLAGGWLAGHIATGAGAGVLVAPFTGPTVSAAAFGILGAALLGAEGLLDAAGRAAAATAGRRILIRTTAATATVLLLAGPLAGLTAWAAQNLLQPGTPAAASADARAAADSTGTAAAAADAGSPAGAGSLGTPRLVQPATPRTLPATATDRGEGPEQARTLIISITGNGGYDATLMRGAGTTLDALSAVAAARSIQGEPGQETVRDDDAVAGSLRSVVATIVVGQGVDPREDLERLGVGFVVLRASDTAAQLTSSRMDAVPGLVAVGNTDAGWLWRISPLNQPVIEAADVAHRVRIVDGAGAAIGLLPSEAVSAGAPVPAGPEGRLVVLAERADPGWTAWLDGQRLTATTSGWAQAFTLPTEAGRLSIRYEAPWALWTAIAQTVVIGLTVLLAIPVPARRPNTGLSRDEGSLRKEHQHA